MFRDRRVGVLGAGRDAARTVSELRPFAADVTWISPTTATAPLRVGAPAGAGEPVTVIEGATVERLEGDRAGAADQMLELAGLFVALPRRARHPQLPGLPEGPL